MLAATYAKQIGRGVAFSLAAFRQAFAAGRNLGDEDTVLIAGAACEMHPTALLKGVALRSTERAMSKAVDRAREARGQPAAGGDRVRALSNRAYELIVSRDGLEPAFLATDERIDRIEVVSIDDGEVVFFWRLPAKRASRLLRELRTDIVSLDADRVRRQMDGCRRGGPV